MTHTRYSEAQTIDIGVLHAPEALIDHLNTHGLAVMHETTPETFFGAFQQIARPLGHRDSGADSVTRLKFRPEVAEVTGFAGFSRQAMPPHTDGSAQPVPPALLANICVTAPHAGGSAILVDGKRAVERLAAEDPSALAQLSRPRSACFGADTEERAVFESGMEGRRYIRYRDDGQLTGAGMEQPLAVLREILHEELQEVDLRPGTAYLLQNGRWLHGRSGFTGVREVLRMLGAPRTVHGRSVEFGFTIEVSTAIAN